MANARAATLQALVEWEKGKAFSDEILHGVFEREGLISLDRAFVMEVFFGVLRHLSELDFLAGRLRPGSLDPRTRNLLRIGLYQLFHLRVAPHAAVHETVELGGKARGLINAVLRRALREKDALKEALAHAPQAARTNHPEFLLARWEAEYGAAATAELCAWNNRPAEVFARVNRLKVTAGELLRSHRASEAWPGFDNVLRVNGQIPRSWITQGLCYMQDPSTLAACELLDPRPGETVLDACAAPGGKTAYLAEMMLNEGRLVACDQFESRVARLRENLGRLGATVAQACVHDSMQMGGPMQTEAFDRVLVDAPCSNTGVLRRRVDVRWRLTEEDFIRMPVQQFALLRRAAQVLKSGGTLVYSTCSLEREENEGVVEQALAGIPGLEMVETRTSLPFRNGVDGAFAAKFVKG